MRISRDRTDPFKDMRARGTDVVCIPLDPADMEREEENTEAGLGFSNKEYKPENAIKFLVVSVGPGHESHGRIIPLDLEPLDIVLTSVESKKLREDWKKMDDLWNDQKFFVFAGYNISQEAGCIYAVVGQADYMSGYNPTGLIKTTQSWWRSR